MNAILTHLQNNWQRFNLEQYGDPSRLSYFMLTPRFRASSHVLFLVSIKGHPNPNFVVKIPRLAGNSQSLEKETSSLRAIQASRPQGFASIPRVLAFEPFLGRKMLIETALVGKVMNPAIVREDSEGCCQVILNWLVELHIATRHSPLEDPDWFNRLIERPFQAFMGLFPSTPEENKLLERTWDLVSPLQKADLPIVIEHGDLSSPNILLLQTGEPGVVDWELADLHGLPACDLFFFLTYVAFARANANTNSQHLIAYQQAFFGKNAWARPIITTYTQQLNIDPVWLIPLFILCWLRYMTGLLIRIDYARPSPERIDPQTAEWLRQNRYYALWRYALDHLGEININGHIENKIFGSFV